MEPVRSRDPRLPAVAIGNRHHEAPSGPEHLADTGQDRERVAHVLEGLPHDDDVEAARWQLEALELPRNHRQAEDLAGVRRRLVGQLRPEHRPAMPAKRSQQLTATAADVEHGSGPEPTAEPARAPAPDGLPGDLKRPEEAAVPGPCVLASVECGKLIRGRHRARHEMPASPAALEVIRAIRGAGKDDEGRRAAGRTGADLHQPPFTLACTLMPRVVPE